MESMPIHKRVPHGLRSDSWTDEISFLRLLQDQMQDSLESSELVDSIMEARVLDLEGVRSSSGERLNKLVVPYLKSWMKARQGPVYIAQIILGTVLVLTDDNCRSQFIRLREVSAALVAEAIASLGVRCGIVPHGLIHAFLSNSNLPEELTLVDFAHSPVFSPPSTQLPKLGSETKLPDHLRALEAESIRIIREAVASAQRPAMLFSLGKDSMTMLRLAEKAFAPEPLPFPLVNIDTRWKFREMNLFRDWLAGVGDLDFIHYINPEAVERNINPFDHGSSLHTEITKTNALKQILEKNAYDFVFGGARRDEEKSRAKERIFSVRSQDHSWNPREQRPELWNHYNTLLTNGQTMRVFPLSNWTELDVWRYVEAESLPIVPLYLARTRPTVSRNNSLIMVDDERFRLEEGEVIEFRKVRFRSLGCYPLSGAQESEASSVRDIIEELSITGSSERSSRLIDFDLGSTMEQKKMRGYF